MEMTLACMWMFVRIFMRRRLMTYLKNYAQNYYMIKCRECEQRLLTKLKACHLVHQKEQHNSHTDPSQLHPDPIPVTATTFKPTPVYKPQAIVFASLTSTKAPRT